MPPLAGDGQVTPHASTPPGRPPTDAHQTGKCCDDRRHCLTFAASIDTIRRFEHARDGTAMDQIPIARARPAAQRIATAVSSPGACPSPPADRAIR